MIYQIKKTEDFELRDWPDAAWDKVLFNELKDVTSGLTITKKAKVKLLWSDEFLYFLFDVEDDHIWGTYEKNDDPIYEQEAVEVFIAHGEGTPKEYLELQFSPKGIKFDGKVSNPSGSRHDAGFNVDIAWDSKLIFKQKINSTGDFGKYQSGRWVTQVKLPVSDLDVSRLKAGDRLRGNLFRIDGYPEQNSFQALVPNMEQTPNFHTPNHFAIFELVED
jgi:hypothetical protein